MKVALVHDWLTGMRGGEKCLEAACELFRTRTSSLCFHRKGSVSAGDRAPPIVTSFLQRLPNVHRYYRYLLPLFPAAIERFDLSGYDLVLSMSHAVAKGAIPPPDAPHACYCFSPMRYVWDLYDDYFGKTAKPIELLVSFAATRLRTWDVCATARVDRIAAISRHVERRVARYYRREATVIYPPVGDAYFEERLPGEKGDYFLVVSSLVPYKRIDVALEAFRRSGDPLWIVGSGPEERRLKALAPPTVRFLGWQPAERLPDLYRNARALVFAGIEDFGIAPLECQAMGRPVVALLRRRALRDRTSGRQRRRADRRSLPRSDARRASRGARNVPQTARRISRRRAAPARRAFRRDRFLDELRGFAAPGIRAC